MLKASNEDRGTIADLATLSRDLEDTDIDGAFFLDRRNIF